ncbi:MAG: sulfurtransferase TusA family protein [Planctomycetes bacterium]|nr:sulfurtransferase TusA family protein [Planctomycetota bacterium]MCB9871086.1 sulfurtransferase TusA family protein [Planctomycetota bacterium]MCB9888276.1 sulfurtransferase TusA family protein [Planctomycetota bacterium]
MTPDESIDCSGLVCPLPIVKTQRAIKKLVVGQVLEMISTDPGAVPDMQAWENQTRHKLLVTETRADGKFRFLVEKTH